MDAPAAIALMVKKSGRTATEVSRAMGKNRNYVAVLEKQQSVPKISTFCRLAHECGFRVIVQSKDDSNDNFEIYSEDDAQNYARELVSNLPSNVNLGDLVKALEDASYSEARPAKTDESVSWEDVNGGVITAEPSMSAKDLEYIRDLTSDGGDVSNPDVKVLKDERKGKPASPR